ncbi:MAG TPA: YeeE/YedE thiosulfate transporter family protein [Streptosporangiaceae bacterium]
MVLDLLPAQLPWWLAGPGLGLCVAGLYGLANRRLGVSGALLAALVAPVEGWRAARWRVEFLAAVIVGALVAGLLGSATRLTGYPVLSTALPAAALIPLLAGGGLALGYGARRAEGCTSGHGLSGCAAGSPDSLAATATFFAAAVAVTFAAHALTGGAL